MKIQYSFKNTQHWEEQRIQEYAELKIRSIEKLLSHFQDDEANLSIRTERFDKNNAYQVEMSLEIPQKNFVGTEASHTIEKALDLAKDRLVKQLKKHEDVAKNKGKDWANLKRAVKDLVESRPHKTIHAVAVDVDMEESARSSEPASKPIKMA